MKNKIFIAFLALFLTISSVFAGGWGVELPTLKLKENNSAFYPKKYIWGTSTFIGDSTDYVILNKGLLIYDSLRVQRDLYVGVTSGKIYLDTGRTGKIYFTGNDLYLENGKSNAVSYFLTNGATSSVQFYTTISASSYATFKSDTGGITIYSKSKGSLTTINNSGINVEDGDYSVTGGTQQYKFSGGADTVYTDYDSNDSVTVNKQVGTIQTKSLTTTAGNEYAITLVNSLIATTSKIFCTLGGNNCSTGIPIFWVAVAQSGDAILYLKNIHASGSLNSWVKINFMIVN